MRTRAALALAVLALVGCGGDDEDSEPAITAPDITVPGSPSAPEDVPTDTAPAETSPPPADTSGGSPAPPAEGDGSPQDETAPAPGTPEDRFERFCEANPGACG